MPASTKATLADTAFLLWRNETVGVVQDIHDTGEGHFEARVVFTREIHPRVAKAWSNAHDAASGKEPDESGGAGFVYFRWAIETVDGRRQAIHMPIPSPDFERIVWSEKQEDDD